MDDTAVADEMLEQLVSMQRMEVSDEDICRALGVGQDDLQRIRKGAAFQKLQSEKMLEDTESQQMMNDGWDRVEQQGIATVLKHLQHSADPDFALRASAMANKAQRRNGNKDRIIQGQVGARAVIYLPNIFVQNVQAGGMAAQAVISPREVVKKAVDMLHPSDVEEMVSPGRKVMNRFIDLRPDLDEGEEPDIEFDDFTTETQAAE